MTDGGQGITSSYIELMSLASTSYVGIFLMHVAHSRKQNGIAMLDRLRKQRKVLVHEGGQ